MHTFNSISYIFKSDWGPDPSDARPLITTCFFPFFLVSREARVRENIEFAKDGKIRAGFVKFDPAGSNSPHQLQGATFV